jgi:hypothetical protein
MSDLLDMTHINSLPHPLYARVCRDWWPVYDIDVQTGLFRIDVCNQLQTEHVSGAAMFRDADGDEHSVDSFYAEETTPEPPK